LAGLEKLRGGAGNQGRGRDDFSAVDGEKEETFPPSRRGSCWGEENQNEGNAVKCVRKGEDFGYRGISSSARVIRREEGEGYPVQDLL